MNNTLNTKEIKMASFSSITNNLSIIGTVLIYSMIAVLLSVGLSFVPVVGPLVALFLTVAIQGYLMLKLEREIVLNEPMNVEIGDLSYKSYISPFLKLLGLTFGALIISLIAGYFILRGVMSEMGFIEGFYITSILVHIMVALIPWMIVMCIIMAITGVIVCVKVMPQIYIATKYREYSEYDKKRIMLMFKENGLSKRATRLELSYIMEYVTLYIGLMIVTYISEPIGMVLTLVYGVVYGSKTILARVILYNDISNQIDIKSIDMGNTIY